ncbi:MAG: hypothetical protein LUH14_07015 [Clostridiaceae bacterium]|nr:hypothetical protein [Clostridiaceae bacterium]
MDYVMTQQDVYNAFFVLTEDVLSGENRPVLLAYGNAFAKIMENGEEKENA